MPLSLGALYATWNTIPIWCAFLFAYLALRLILPEQPPWKRFVLLLLLLVFLGNVVPLTHLPVLLFAVFLRGWYAVRDGLCAAPTSEPAARCSALSLSWSPATSEFTRRRLG